MSINRGIQRATGIWWQAARGHFWDEDALGPRPAAFFALRGPGSSWVRLEIGLGSFRFWLSWGHELTPGERVENALVAARLP